MLYLRILGAVLTNIICLQSCFVGLSEAAARAFTFDMKKARMYLDKIL